MTDWKSLVSDLRGPNENPRMTWKDIAAAVGVQNVSTITEIASGRTKEPRHSTGQKLLRLHKRLGVNQRAA